MFPLPRTPQQITGTVLAVNFVLLCLYDLGAVVAWGRDASISGVISDACHANPIIAAGLGLLIGHMLWPVR